MDLTKEIPYVAVFGIKSWKDTIMMYQWRIIRLTMKQQPLFQGVHHPRKGCKKFSQSKERKIRIRVNENQEHYNAKMKQARGKATSFRVDDVVAIKLIKSIRPRLFTPMSLLAKFFMLKIITLKCYKPWNNFNISFNQSF